ncbi:MAG: T9SS type A sorting domain-containing protein, partial [Saprospiraceae bacterium]|nr:T9SS type A sorting domain-containing protein [Saprospiraceae bacterium]
TAEYTIEQMGQNKPALAAEDTIVCAGEQAQLRVSGLAPGSEIRIFRNNEQVTTVPVSDTVFYIAVAPLSSSTYFVQVVDTCMLSSNTIQITVETAVEPEVTHLNDTLYSNPPCTICQWLLNNNPIPGATESFYAPTVSGIYELQVTSPNGCVYESSGVQVVISEASLPASVSEFKLTPNPTDGHLQLHLMLKSMEHMTISLADASHRQIFMKTRHSDHLDLPIDLSGLPSGAYVLTVEMAGGNIVRKVVKR